MLKCLLASTYLALLDESVTVHGILYLLDISNFSMRHKLFWGIDDILSQMKFFQVGNYDQLKLQTISHWAQYNGSDNETTVIYHSVICYFFQGSFPVRFKGFHCYNEGPMFDALYAMAKPFMSDKLKQRVSN